MTLHEIYAIFQLFVSIKNPNEVNTNDLLNCIDSSEYKREHILEVEDL